MAHETITAEQDRWGSTIQLIAEYETIVVVTQYDRQTTLIRSSGFTVEQAQAVIDSDALGTLTTELRRAKANHHNVDTFLPYLVQACEAADADDIASVIHHRLAHVTARSAGPGRTHQAPRPVAGLIPEAISPMTPDIRQASTERHHLIETRAEAVLDAALHIDESWTITLGLTSTDGRERQHWRHRVLAVAAYRDRYQIIDPDPPGTQLESTAQKINRIRALVTVERVQMLVSPRSSSTAPRSVAAERKLVGSTM